jgi:hypothetical protein
MRWAGREDGAAGTRSRSGERRKRRFKRRLFMNRYWIAGVLIMLLAQPLVMPSVADADCPDTNSVTCSKYPIKWPHTYRALNSPVGRCMDAWNPTNCKVSNCSNWKENLIKQCRELLQEQSGAVSYFDDEYTLLFLYY